MNSRERVQAVINHKLPDRVPNGLGGCETAGLHVLTYNLLQEVLGLTPKTPPRLNTFMTNAVFEPALLTAMGGDILLVDSPRMCAAPLHGKNWEKEWKEQHLWQQTFSVPVSQQFQNHADGSIQWLSTNTWCPPGSHYFSSKESANILQDFDFPSPDTFCPPMDFPETTLRRLEETAKYLYENTTFSLCMGETITDLQYVPGGMVGGMIYMLENPEGMGEILQKSVDAGLSQLKLLQQAVGKYVDILSIAHDFGDNRCVTIGAPLWREIYKPYYQQFFAGWKKISSMKINLHSCGSIADILPDLIACGVDIYNPVQISANHMDATVLKETFGKDLVFWGGAYDTQCNPSSDSYELVYNRACKTIGALAAGGGYIMAGVHNLPTGVPPHHLKALLDAWQDTASYK